MKYTSFIYSQLQYWYQMDFSFLSKRFRSCFHLALAIVTNHMDLQTFQVPQQKNGDECGKFVLYFIHLFMEAAPANFRIKDYPYFVSLLFLRTSTVKHASLTFSSSKCHRDSINELDWCLADERELVYRRRCLPILQDIWQFG